MPDHENILTPPLMLVRYAGMASLLTTVWESRRKWQDRAEEAEGRARSTKILAERHVDALSERIKHLRGERNELRDSVCGYEAIRQQQSALRQRAAELEAFIADIASHGLRCDLNPTMDCSTPDKHAEGMLRYLRSVDASMRSEARRLVPETVTPYSPGRPGPTPKIETVAECVTELDVLRAQDGHR